MRWTGTLRTSHQPAGRRGAAVRALAAICCAAMTAPAHAQATAEVPGVVHVTLDGEVLETCVQALGNVLSPPEASVRVTPGGIRGLGPSHAPAAATEPDVSVTDACLTLGGRIGLANLDLGSGIGLGTLPGVPGNEPLFVPHGGRLWGGTASIGMEVVTPDVSFDWNGFYSRVGGSLFASEPIGGAPVAYTFGEDSFGSTGLFLGATGADTRSEVSYSQFGMEMDILALRHMYGADVATTPGQIALSLAGLFDHSVLHHTGVFESLTFLDITADVDRRLSSTRIGLGPSLGMDINLGNVTLTSDVSMMAIWRQSDLDSLEAITCGPCGGGLPGAFDINIVDSVSGLDWQAGLDLGVETALNPSLTLVLGGSLDIGGRDTIRVRANPSDPVTGIERIVATDWGFTAGIKGRF